MLRLAPLLGIAALAVHQLRYAIAPAAEGAGRHGYLGAAGALAAGVLVVGLAALLAPLARGGAAPAPAPRLARMWAGTTLSLLTVFVVQELAEGSSPVAHGGWLAAPLAALVAFLVAVLARGASGAAARRPWRIPPRVREAVRVATSAPRRGTTAPRLRLARGPPAASA